MTEVRYIMQFKKSTDTEWSYRPHIDVFHSLANAQDRKARFDMTPNVSSIIWESRIVKVTTEVVS